MASLKASRQFDYFSTESRSGTNMSNNQQTLNVPSIENRKSHFDQEVAILKFTRNYLENMKHGKTGRITSDKFFDMICDAIKIADVTPKKIRGKVCNLYKTYTKAMELIKKYKTQSDLGLLQSKIYH